MSLPEDGCNMRRIGPGISADRIPMAEEHMKRGADF